MEYKRPTKRQEEEEKDYEAILFGTALHYALEMLGAFDLESLALSMTALGNRYGQQLNLTQLEQIQNRIKLLLENPTFQDLLPTSTIRKEQSLSYEGELKQIDLLLEYENHCIVIDYKSSQKYTLKHQNQVGYYKKAIANITGKRTEGFIVYLLEDEVRMVGV